MNYAVTEQNILELEALNLDSQFKVIVCDNGYGNSISDTFLEIPGFEAHIAWFNSANLEPIDENEVTI